MSDRISLGVAISEEVLGEAAPVLFQGGILDGLEKASEFGFDAVELHVRDPHKLDAAAIRNRASDLGVKIAAVGTGLENSKNGLCLTAEAAEDRKLARQAMHRHLDFAAEFGAVVFVGLIRGSAGERRLVPHKLDLLAEELVPIAEAAVSAGVTTGLEPVAYYFSNLLNTTQETVEFVQRPGLESVGLLIDTHHIVLEDPGQTEAFLTAGDRLAYVQASDSNRRYPGAGNVDWAEVAAVLRQLNFSGVVALEVLAHPNPDEAAARGLEKLRNVFDTQSI